MLNPTNAAGLGSSTHPVTQQRINEDQAILEFPGKDPCCAERDWCTCFPSPAKVAYHMYVGVGSLQP